MAAHGPLTNGMASLKSLPTKKLSHDKKEKRKIKSDDLKVATGKTIAMSSHKALFFHDIPPELIRRIAKRYTGETDSNGVPLGGHVKYGIGHLNLNWRIGLGDPEYIADRFNHLVEHLLYFLEDGNEKDDNLAAIGWCLGFLMESERHAPEAFKSVFGQCKLFGESAKSLQDKMRK
jgi:hypothetical protein